MVDDYVFIDIQGFNTTAETFIAKEFCLIHRDYLFHTIIKSPCTLNELWNVHRHEANWVSWCEHGLKFDSGEMTLLELVQSTRKHVRGKTVIVKGAKKSRMGARNVQQHRFRSDSMYKC